MFLFDINIKLIYINYHFIVELDFKNKIIIRHMSAKGDNALE
jgi:hypothetical protein